MEAYLGQSAFRASLRPLRILTVDRRKVTVSFYHHELIFLAIFHADVDYTFANNLVAVQARQNVGHDLDSTA